MCHCKHSIKTHVKIYKRSSRNLVRIWNALSLSISCNCKMSCLFEDNFFYEFKLEYKINFITFI